MPKIIQVSNFDHIFDDEWRILTAVETGMRNHEFVQIDMIHNYAGIQHSGKNFVKILRNSLVPYRLVCFDNNGYRLTNLGYDFLSLHKLIKSKIVYDVSNFQMFGTGKESDLYVCKPGELCLKEFNINSEHPIVLKFHRLGRTSFRQVTNKREYKTGNSCSWLYMNRISATREYHTMKELYEAKLPVPIPLGQNRGVVAMEYINSVPLFKFSKDILENGAAPLLYAQAKILLVKLAELGLVHGDLNEFNLLVEVDSTEKINQLFPNENVDELSDENNDDDGEEDEEEEEEEEDDYSGEENESSDEICENNENNECPYMDQDINTFKLRMIDFPQVISRNNKTAQEIYARDRNGLISFFQKFTKISEKDFPPENIDDIERIDYLDVNLKAPGYPRNIDKIRKNSEELSEDELCTKVVTDIKRRAPKERSKQQVKSRISKQQRNTVKTECRKDFQNDFF